MSHNRVPGVELGNGVSLSLRISIKSLCMGTSRGRRFRRALFIKWSIFQGNRRLRIRYKKLFCLVTLLVFEKQFHFGSDTSDYITMLKLSSMKTGIQLSPEMIYRTKF